MKRFPGGFLWGCATSSHQVEGDQDNDWTDWEAQPGRIHDGTTSGDAIGWWKGRAEEDLALARSLGQNAIRISLEWSRLEPELGRWDEDAFARYEQILRRARELGLTALVTLSHFTLPRWIAERGGWLAKDAPMHLGRYADRCARRLGELVPLWATLNEPSVLAFLAYAGKEWPPGKGDVRAGMAAIRAQLLAHAAAYHAVHDVRRDAKVGLVINCPILDPERPDRRRDRAAAAAQDWAFNGAVIDALAHARFRFPLALGEEKAPALRGTLDFLGLNYYGRYRVRFDPRAGAELFGRRSREGTVRTEHNDWGEPYPEGLTRNLVRLHEALHVPLYVTENGVFDPTDVRRREYIASHVRAVHDAIAKGCDVRGYFVWTLVDNFEWAEGWSTPFGLMGQERAPRESARVLERIARANAIE